MPPVATAAAAPIDPAIAELTKQFSQLALLLKASIESTRPMAPAASTAPTAPQVGAPFRQFDRPRYCMWCDATEHSRYRCPEFPEAIRQGLIRLNERNRVVNAATGLELPLMFGKGGMKMPLEQPATTSNNVFTATTTNITIDDLCGQLGENSVMITTLDFENDTRTDEIIDVDVWEKRKHGGPEKERRVRSRIDVRPIPEFNPIGPGPMNRTWPIPSPPLQTVQPSPSPEASQTAREATCTVTGTLCARPYR